MVSFIKKIGLVCLLIWALSIQLTSAQVTPFSAVWSFEGNDNGTSSNASAGVSAISYVGVNKLFGTYQSGYAGLGVSLQHWSVSGCTYGEYAQFSIQPQGTAQVTLTSLSFAFSSSSEGPQQLTVRSSADGFSSDIYSRSTSGNYQVASITLSGSNFSNQTSAITFRIYGCNPTSSNGTLRLDEITINGTVTSAPLPVTLLSFTANPEGDRVQLAWATTSEQNADHFLVERSYDLGEYTAVGEVAAKSTTDTRYYYGLTDLNPKPGINYYRLKQIDRDGTTQSFKPVEAIIRTDEPVASVYPNPTNSNRIHLRLWNADDATVQLRSMTGQQITGRLERQAGEADLVFEQPLAAGLYWLDVHVNGRRRVIKVLVP
ncbi:T9SS type A sorting domain-containing protein [Spirosoma foliorum]|uniref:T9SS type A sorting domain-containing protein n=1 Tax=Spirosoma foliorum TaxID=2710596 RepID=A0A7G5GVF8_9BACT|nr:T9SS type A sorting domain-containing protein [Spirosoma foliorum]QMW02850.1 T9SS type A sorting domain-containing protein [Spirosoma foliorum]